MTDGRGADVCVDAVGMEAHRTVLEKAANVLHGQVGTISTLKLAFSAVRRGGVVPIVGVYGVPYDNFPLGQFFDKGLRMRAGQAPAHNFVDQILKHIQEGHLRTDDIITHRLPLSRAPHGYEVFNKKLEDCVKVVLTP